MNRRQIARITALRAIFEREDYRRIAARDAHSPWVCVAITLVVTAWVAVVMAAFYCSVHAAVLAPLAEIVARYGR